jgi:hypothetical protein
MTHAGVVLVAAATTVAAIAVLVHAVWLLGFGI